jgi:superoxide dismutase, Fe-Mn family
MPRNSVLSRRSFLRTTALVGAGIGVVGVADSRSAAGPAAELPIKQAPLPFADTALEPFISAKTFGFHYGKHHKAYVDKANELLAGSPLAAKSVPEIIRAVAGKPEQAAIFNNVAQAWNHEFFWKCLKPGGGGAPGGKLGDAIQASFGGFEAFSKQFVDAGLTQFGSGWAWLVKDGAQLKIVKTPNADTPVARGQTPILTCDVWEHAYYLDYQNRRKDFVETFLAKLANWEFAASLL